MNSPSPLSVSRRNETPGTRRRASAAVLSGKRAAESAEMMSVTLSAILLASSALICELRRPVTTICSIAISRVMSPSACWLAATETVVGVGEDPNSDVSKVSVYDPLGTRANRYRPLASVVVDCPVSRIVTIAPTTGLPSASEIRPAMLPEPACWASLVGTCATMSGLWPLGPPGPRPPPAGPTRTTPKPQRPIGALLSQRSSSPQCSSQPHELSLSRNSYF